MYKFVMKRAFSVYVQTFTNKLQFCPGQKCSELKYQVTDFIFNQEWYNHSTSTYLAIYTFHVYIHIIPFEAKIVLLQSCVLISTFWENHSYKATAYIYLIVRLTIHKYLTITIVLLILWKGNRVLRSIPFRTLLIEVVRQKGSLFFVSISGSDKLRFKFIRNKRK